MPRISNHNFESEKSLPPLLHEFRCALRDEIEAAKRSASNNAIPLSNGHRIGQQGSAFQYVFLIDSVLNTPDGAPADLIVPGKASVQVTIVSSEGLRLVISVESDLGEFVPNARIQTNLAILMRKLIERIENNASSSNPSAARMLGMKHVSGTPYKPEKTPSLNASQMLALESALGRDLTVIWGPPGTGKTHTIGTIAQYLHDSNRTVLIVSHTNSAVDQAIRHIASALPEHLEQGDVIRVGEVRDEILKSDFPDVMLKRQVMRQSVELMTARDNLVSQKRLFDNELESTQRKISAIEWIDAPQVSIEALEADFAKWQSEQERLVREDKRLAELNRKHLELLEFHKLTANILAQRKKITSNLDEESRLKNMLSTTVSELKRAKDRLQEQENRLQILLRISPLREERKKYPSAVEQKSIVARISKEIVDLSQQLASTQTRHGEANVLLEKTRNSTFRRLFWGWPNPQVQEKIVADLSKQVATLKLELSATKTKLDAANAKLARMMALDAELVQHQSISDYPDELAKQKQALETLSRLEKKKAEIEFKLKDVSEELAELVRQDRHQSQGLPGDAKDVYLRVCAELRELNLLNGSAEKLRSEIKKLRADISSDMSTLTSALLNLGVISNQPDGLDETLQLIREARARALVQKKSDLPLLSAKAQSLSSEILRITEEISNIDARLAEIERNVIAKASVLGATLTKVYLSDDIQARKFATVILDEASMAPIPALWTAALLSDKNLIIVGDFKQLPPIVLSKNELTRKWLGRDIFDVSGLKTQWQNGNAPDFFVPLNEQRRMLPEIADVANLFYDGLLRTPLSVTNGAREFSDWYNIDWSHDNPIALVDTGSLNAWVTSVVKSGNSSRLNFLSATVAVDLAEQLLLPDRSLRTEGAPKRILIVSPYRAQAKLVSILLNESKHLRDEAIAGTAYSVQGCEADVVIFDLVADEPHFRVNLFMESLDEQLMRLLNVGLTRAKFRLFIIGDFRYCLTKGRRAFLGRTLLPFLMQRFPVLDASRLFPEGLAARAAKAQMKSLGGQIEPDSDRIVVSQEDFFRLLSSDLSRAKSRIVIYSPFMTSDRVAFLMPQLQAALSRGVAVFIITKSHSERRNTELPQIRQIEAQLSEINAVVMHKMRMHEKLVLIDDDVTWSGSLNPLSFSNTQEVMERRKSKAVLEDYWRILRTAELLSVHGKPECKCPICGAEIMAAEGRDDPYYWRCVNDECYTRSIDQPYPFEGVLLCAACNSPVEFGYWSEYPHWRCIANNRHRQRIFKSHLLLPKMAALIPKPDREKVCKLLKIDNCADYFSGRNVNHGSESSTARVSAKRHPDDENSETGPNNETARSGGIPEDIDIRLPLLYMAFCDGGELDSVISQTKLENFLDVGLRKVEKPFPWPTEFEQRVKWAVDTLCNKGLIKAMDWGTWKILDKGRQELKDWGLA